MKAVVQEEYGPPDVLELKDVAVVAETVTAAACSSVRLVGLGAKFPSSAHAYSARAPVAHQPNTSSPG